MHNTVTPTLVRRHATRTAITAGALAGVVLAAWAFRLVPDTRPILVVMLYLLLVAIALGASVTAIGAHCHLTVQRAFLAGLHVGTTLPQEQPQHPHPTPLRVVD